MDEFEHQLSDSLRRQAARSPHFGGDYGAVHRRGRMRLWAVRGAGAFGALALVGLGVAAWSNLDTGAETTEVATEFTPSMIAPTPTPTPTPSPTPVPVVIDIPTPPVDSVEPDNPDAASLVVATGWGVGLVKDTGDQYAPVVCCQDDLPWWEQAGEPYEGGTVHRGAVTARDDLDGGLVTATRSALRWVPAASLDTGEAQLIRGAPAPDTADGTPETQWLQLWDVTVNEGPTEVLYSTVELDQDADFGGTVTLFAGTLDESLASVELESFTWTSADDDWYDIRGASWLPGGGWMTLKSHGSADNACAWIDFGPTDAAVDLASPFPKPDELDSCPHRTLDAASVDDAGEVVAISEIIEGREELAMYRLSDGATVNRVALPSTAQDQGRWTEIDFGADAVLISRGEGMAPEAWPTDDETVLIGRDDPDASRIAYIGSVSWPRGVVSTEGLEALDPRGELWFGARVEQSEQAIDADAADQSTEQAASGDVEEQAAADATPQPSPEATSEGQARRKVRARDRRPAGRGNNIAPASALPGTNGCAGTADQGVCIGWEFGRASATLDAAFEAPEQTTNPDTFLEGEAHPPGTHVWVSETRRVTIEVVDDVVVQVAVTPENAEGTSTPFEAELTFGDVLAELGAPAEIFQGGGEGTNVVTVSYDTDAGYVHYSYVEFPADGSSIDESRAPLERMPEAYDDLPVVAFRAQATS